MQEVYEFLKQCGTYYLSTVDGDRPRVRPFGTANIFENRLYFQTGRVKNVYRQIKANPKIEICALLGERWLRLAATAVEDDRAEASQSMLDAYPSLQDRYQAGDGNTTAFYLKDATATFFSPSEPPKVVRF